MPPPPDLTGTIDNVLGGSGVPTLPTDTVDSLLGTSNPQPPGGGGGGGTSGGGSSGSTPGDSAPGGGTTGGTGSTSSSTGDTRAPRLKLKVLSKFAWVARTGRLKARVSSDEAGVVAIGGTARVKRRLTKLRASVVAYRASGARTVTVRLPRAALRRLRHARSVRLSLNAVAVDAARNQRSATLKVTLTRPRKVAHLRRNRSQMPRRTVDSRR